MAERKITVRNVSIILHVGALPQYGSESVGKAETDASNIAHAVMLTLAKEGYKIPDMTCEVVK